MRFLITGATGYIGTNLCQSLLIDGHDICCIVRKTSDTSNLTSMDSKNIKLKSPSTYEETVKTIDEEKPDIVIHLASLFIARHKSHNIIPLIESNITFPTQLLEAMSECGINRFINIGSLWQNYDGSGYNPSCLYAATKQAFQDIMKYYEEACEIRSITLKLSDTYGPDDPRPKILNLILKSAQTGDTLAMSPGEQLLDFVYIDDVVRAIKMATEILISKKNKITPNEYVISSKKPLTLIELTELIAEKTNAKLNIEWGALSYRDREIMVPCNGGKWLPGWEPKVDIESGIKSLKW